LDLVISTLFIFNWGKDLCTKVQPVVCDSPFKPDNGVEQWGEEEDVDPRERDSDDFRWLETQDFVKNSIRPVGLHSCWV